MATSITYVSALSDAILFMETNGFEDENILAKLRKLRDQKATRSKSGKKSAARTANEQTAQVLVDVMREKGVTEIRAAWVRDNVDGVNTVPKAVAILNVANDMGLLITERRELSATRSELVYKLAK